MPKKYKYRQDNGGLGAANATYRLNRATKKYDQAYKAALDLACIAPYWHKDYLESLDKTLAGAIHWSGIKCTIKKLIKHCKDEIHPSLSTRADIQYKIYAEKLQTILDNPPNMSFTCSDTKRVDEHCGSECDCDNYAF